MFQDQNAKRSHNMKIDKSFFEMVKGFRYLGTTLKNQNSFDVSRSVHPCTIK
jgi:hypothetical protein